MDIYNNTEETKQKKVPVSFSENLIPKMDKHWRGKDFRSRTEYLNYLVRKDMENHGKSIFVERVHE